MLNLEQVRLLEARVAKAVEYVERLTGENASLRQKETELQAKMESYQKRIDELEIVMLQFKEDQGQIEDGILSALDRLNRFEDAMDKSLKGKPAAAKGAGGRDVHVKDAHAKDAVKAHPAAYAAPAGTGLLGKTVGQAAASDNAEICFEISDGMADDAAVDIDPLRGELDVGLATGKKPPAQDGELDIF